MTVFVDLLRGVNVSGRNRLPMAELRTALAGAGFARAETYLQSGNIVCEAPDADAAAHGEAVRGLILATFGLDVAVVALPAAVLSAVAAGNPFLAADPAVDQGWLHATFLAAPAAAAAFEALKLPAAEGEAAALSADGRLVYLRLPHGYGRTRLGNAWFERALNVPATTRNWRTVLALAELAAARPR